jgi:hypothetical protein
MALAILAEEMMLQLAIEQVLVSYMVLLPMQHVLTTCMTF